MTKEEVKKTRAFLRKEDRKRRKKERKKNGETIMPSLMGVSLGAGLGNRWIVTLATEGKWKLDKDGIKNLVAIENQGGECKWLKIKMGKETAEEQELAFQDGLRMRYCMLHR